MSTFRYLEFDSTYRDRNLWPLPSNFRIDISQSGVKGRLQALDPISDEAPRAVFTGSFQDNAVSATVAVNTLYNSQILGEGDFDTSSSFEVTSVAGVTLRMEEDFYVGSVIEFGDVRRRITGYKFIDRNGVDTALITVEPSLPDEGVLTTPGQIINPTDTALAQDPLLYIPEGVQVDNFYKNCIVYNVNANDTRTIVRSYGNTNVSVLDSPAPGWNATDTYIIRNNLPCNSGVVGASTTTTITLESTASDVDDFYVGGFIRIGLIPAAIVPPFDSLPAPYNESRRIVSYNGTTKVATVHPPFSVAPAAPNNTYDVECFTRDNVVPFDYTGSLVSQQQAVCYEVELLNVVLPNQTLYSGIGGRIAFYPYVYVGLEAVSSSTTNSSTNIYSNNPNSTRKMFRASCDDTQTPLLAPFVKIDGDGMVQTIKFKPNDSFVFTVCHSDGSLFQTVEEEKFAPSAPNPLIQISALFSIRRVADRI